MKSVSDTSEAARRKRERIIMVAVVILIALLSLVEYYLIAGSGPITAGNNMLIFAVINFNVLLILLLSYLIVRNLVKLFLENRQNILGAKLRTKLVIAFVGLSLLPTVMLFLVSFQFISTSLRYWFDVKVERSLENALTIGSGYYQERVSQIQKLTQQAGSRLSLKCISDEAGLDAACLREWAGPGQFMPGTGNPQTAATLDSLEVIGPTHEQILLKTSLPLVGPPPKLPASEVSRIFEGKENLVHSSSLENGELIRVLHPLMNGKGDVLAILVLGTLIPQNINQLLDEIRTGFEDYSQLRLYQNPIKATLLINLFLITLIILFVAIWFGFRLARGITEPVRMLATATQRVAQGDLDFTLETEGRDELSTLVQAFNIMTGDLKEAKRRAEEASRQLQKSYAELEQRRRYIEIILQNVGAGVISINRRGIVTTMNRSAETILERSAADIVGRPYTELLTGRQAEEFETIRQELILSPKDMLQRPMRLDVGDHVRSLLVNFTVLRDQEGRSLGVVIVFDDLTEMEKIQRIAAWREVARRIAHEVKNPLTPIQLSAQRLRKKYLKTLDEDEKAVFERCTATIISQVEDLKGLVNEFSNFARMPSARLRPTSVPDLVDEVLAIYREGHPQIKFESRFQKSLPRIYLDPDQIKRALVNLTENALASMPGGGTISIEAACDEQQNELRLSVSDTGTGISPRDRPRLFEPYFSKRKGGTGLGLAIVNSIVAEHNGRIQVEDNKPRGTTFILILPARREDA